MSTSSLSSSTSSSTVPITQLFANLQQALINNPLDARIIGGRFKLIIGSLAYIVDLDASPAVVKSTSPDEIIITNPPVETTITYKSETAFLDLYERKMSPQAAYIQGLVTMDGEMNSVVKVKRAFDILRRDEELKKNTIPDSLSTNTNENTNTGLTMIGIDSSPPLTPTKASPAKLSSKKSIPKLSDVVKQTMQWKDTTSCEICGAAFNFLRRRHHCRTCHKCICDNCSMKTAVRICIVCNQLPANTIDTVNKTNEDSSFMSPVSTIDETNPTITSPSSSISTDNIINANKDNGKSEENNTNTKDTIKSSSSTLMVPSTSTKGISSIPNSTLNTTEKNNNTNLSSTQTDEHINKLMENIMDLQTTLAKTSTDLASLKEESAATGAQIYESFGLNLVYSILGLFAYLSYASYTPTSDTSNIPQHISTYIYVFIFLFILYLRCKPSHSLSRIIRAFYAVAVVLLGLRKLRANTAQMSDEESEPIWDAGHRKYARFLVRQLMDLRGLWVKVGQYLSSRADIVPIAYVTELSKLQDANPAENFSHVQKMIEKELGIQDIHSIFQSIDPVPLGSASIAQVHKGVLQRPAMVKIPKIQIRNTSTSSSSSLTSTPPNVLISKPFPTIDIEWEEVPITEVVIKIQHKGIETIMKQDLWTLYIIVRFVAYMEKEYDFRPVLDEWAKESVKELNFIREAAVTRHMAHITSAAQLRVGVPQVIGLDTIRMINVKNPTKEHDTFVIDLPHHRNRIAKDTNSANIEFPTDLPAGALATRRLLITQYVDAQKITDTVYLDKIGVDRTKLLTEICCAYGIYLHVEGVFSGDPHPANVLVDKQGKAWLIDYGLTKVLPPAMRLAFAAMVAASQESDAGALLDSFDAMGLKLSREAPGDDLDNMRFMLRDTLPPKEARSRMMAVRKVWAERIAKRKAAKLRKPIESWPADLLLYLRASEILRGLGSSLAVRVRYMQIMAYASVAALRAHYDVPYEKLATIAGHGPTARSRKLKVTGTAATTAHYAQLQWIAAVAHTIQPYIPENTSNSLTLKPKSVPSTVPFPVPELLGTSIESRLYGLINALYHAKKLTGIQIAVCRYGKDMLIDIAAGELGPLNAKPVTSSTLFNVFSATKGVTATLLHMVMDEYQQILGSKEPLSYDSLVTSVWPEYAQRAVDTLPPDSSLVYRNLAESKQKTTIKHILTHSTGLQHALPSDISMGKLADLEAMIKSMEEAVPVWVPGTATTYHYLSFGWLITGVIRGIIIKLAQVDNQWKEWLTKGKFSIGRLLHTLIAEKLQIENEMFIGLPVDEKLSKDSGRLAILSGTVSSAASRLTTSGSNVAMPVENGTKNETKGNTNMLEMLESMLQRAENEANAAHPLGSGMLSPSSTATNAVANTPSTELSVMEARRTDMKALLTLLTTLREKVYLFDPRLFNRMLLRQGEIPAANGHFTARALAKLYSTLSSSILLKNGKAVGSGMDKERLEIQQRLEQQLPVLLSTDRLSMALSPQVTERQQANVFVQGGSSTNWGLGYQLFGHNNERDYRTGLNTSTNGNDDYSMLMKQGSGDGVKSPSGTGNNRKLWGRVRTAVLGTPNTMTNATDLMAKGLDESVDKTVGYPKPTSEQAYIIENLDERGITEDLEAIVQQTLHPPNSSTTSIMKHDTEGEINNQLNTTVTNQSSREYIFGHSGLGGSLAFGDPQTGIGIAILVNQLAADKSVTAAILRVLAKEYNLPSFASY